MGFHIVKSLFIRLYKLPESFDFAKYLRRSLSEMTIEHLDVKESTWAVMCTFQGRESKLRRRGEDKESYYLAQSLLLILTYCATIDFQVFSCSSMSSALRS